MKHRFIFILWALFIVVFTLDIYGTLRTLQQFGDVHEPYKEFFIFVLYIFLWAAVLVRFFWKGIKKFLVPTIGLWAFFIVVFTLYIYGTLRTFHEFGYVHEPFKEFLIFVLYIFLWAVVLARFFWKENKKFLVPTIGFWVFVLLLIPEIVFRLSGQLKLYNESNGESNYVSSFYTEMRPDKIKYTPGAEVLIVKDEFTVHKKANGLGYIDKEWSDVDTTAFVVAALGDSFTEGVGADKPWVEELKMLLLEQCNQHIESMNAGISGYDPVYNYYNLKTDILSYKPDVVLLAFNSTDIEDLFYRGCMARFDSTQVQRLRDSSPWFDYWYGISYSVRAIATAMGYNKRLMSETDKIRYRKEALVCLQGIFQAYQTLANHHNYSFAVVFHPDKNNVVQNTMDEFEEVKAQLSSLDIAYIDLLPYYRDSVGINDKNVYDHYWPLDRHQKDYRIFAEGVLHGLGCGYFEHELAR